MDNQKSKNVAKRLGFECQAVIDEYPQRCLENKPKEAGIYTKKQGGHDELPDNHRAQ